LSISNQWFPRPEREQDLARRVEHSHHAGSGPQEYTIMTEPMLLVLRLTPPPATPTEAPRIPTGRRTARIFSLMIAGLASTLPATLTNGLRQQGMPAGLAHQIGTLPPVASLFSAVLDGNPVEHLLTSAGALASLPAANRQALTGREFFPQLISGPFHQGLVVVFATATALSVVGALASLLRGRPALPDDGPPDDDESSPHPRRRTVTLTTLDPTPALVVIDLQKGVLALSTAHPAADVIERSARLAVAFRRYSLPVVLVTDAMIDMGAVRKVFPRLGETTTSQELLDALARSPARADTPTASPRVGDT
jgi:Isochorismatase family